MNNLKLYINIVFVGLAFNACIIEELPEPTVIGSDPFDFTIEFNGQQIQSKEDYYMHTSYAIDADFDVYRFSGFYGEVDCISDCGPSLSLDFYDIAPVGNQNVDILKVIEKKEYQLTMGYGMGVYNYVALLDSFSPPEQFCWIDLQGADVYCDQGEVSAEFLSGIKYFYQDGTEIHFFKTFDLLDTQNDPIALCLAYNPITSKYEFSVQGVEVSDYDISWEFGAGSFSTEATLELTALELDYPVLLHVVKKGQGFNQSVEALIIVAPNQFASTKCIFGYNIELEDPDIFGTVDLRFVDTDGQEYVAFSGFPGMDSYFRVTEVSMFEKNPQEEPTVIFDFEYDGLFVNLSTGDVIEAPVSGTFAVAYPE